MCSPDSPPQSNAAAEARQQEDARAAQVRAGAAAINRIFDGGRVQTGTQATPNPAYQQALLGQGPAFSIGSPNTVSVGGEDRLFYPVVSPTGQTVGQVQADSADAARVGAEASFGAYFKPDLNAIPEYIETPVYENQGGAFGDQFFADAEKSYMDFYTPQLDRQYTEASRDMKFNLARQGILESTEAADQFGDATRVLGEQRSLLANQAVDLSNNLRSEVENTRSDLLALNQASADPALAASAASARASAIRPDVPTQPLANAFSGLVNNFGLQVAADRQFNRTPRLNFGLGDSSTVVRG